MNIPLIRPALPLLLVALTAACGGRGADPYEPLNRQVHALNAGLDANIVRPLTRKRGGSAEATAAATTPAATPASGQPTRLVDGVANVGSNLSLPGKALNSLLQGRIGAAAQNTGRFVVNTTLGVGGMLDPAGQEFALTEVDTDFGQTLHVWGVPEGAYLVLPVIGPSSERDAVGRVVDWVIDPTGNWFDGNAAIAATGTKLVGKLRKRARYGETVDSVLYGSADSYTQTKLMYQQHRRFELGEEAEAIDPYSE